MDLEELRAFVAVAETGSYLSAADSLGMSRTTLRRKVDALEARAGVALVEGTHKGVVLTDAGQVLASHGRRMMQEMSSVLASVRDMGASPRGTLRVVLPVGMPPHVMAELFRSMRVAFPELSFDCRFSNDPIREELENIELAAHFSETSPGSHWLSFPILKMRTRLVATASYLETHGEPKTLDELSAHELVSWQAPGETGLEWPTTDGQRVSVSPRLVASDVHLVRSCAWSSLGIAYLPEGMMPEPPGTPSLSPVLADRVGCELTLRVSVPKALAEVPKLRMVLDRVRAFVA